MKKLNKISVFLIRGLAFLFLLNSIGSTFAYGDQPAETSTDIEINILSFTQKGHTQVQDLSPKNPLSTFFFDIEEVEEEEESKKTQVSYYSKEQFTSTQSIDPTYLGFILSIPQPKRYLLFHALKIDC